MVKNKLIVKNGIRTLLFLKPGIDKVLLVINKFVNDTVVLIPDKSTLNIAKSCAPKPVNFVFDEKGVINVHPDIVDIEFEHFIIKTFFLLFLNILKAVNQKELG
jgi:hypothetical protein